MTHDERARKWLKEHGSMMHPPEDQKVASLAAEFAEVEEKGEYEASLCRRIAQLEAKLAEHVCGCGRSDCPKVKGLT